MRENAVKNVIFFSLASVVREGLLEGIWPLQCCTMAPSLEIADLMAEHGISAEEAALVVRTLKAQDAVPWSFRFATFWVS